MVEGESTVPKIIDRAGVRYGRLVAQRMVGRNSYNKIVWECLCDCGNLAEVPTSALASGNTQSCGCLFLEKITKHGGFGKRSYNTWRAMVRRCNNPADKDYPRYGGKGVTVCDRWLVYENFVEDMAEPPDGHTLDRIEGNKGYFLENCRWASLTVQARNTRSNPMRGIMPYRDRWYAQIGVNGEKEYSKIVDTVEEAMQKRREMEELYWGDER